ncbi:MAG: hypothetical protein JST46_18045 [Bacteroidetes bacterium]|nr:hypothetical protein [Bacteroidota bacterium]
MAAGQMRQLINIGLLILVSCGTPTETVDNSFYTDKRLSFYDPSDENFSLNVWIRKPENIRTLHETFKKYGYSKIFSDYDLSSNPCMIWSYINKPCSTLIDSLILTYPQSDKAPKYYKEFWDRRKAEQNDTTVFAVLKEVKDELINKNKVTFNDRQTNDTIYNLLRIKFKQPDNEAEATDNFNYLLKVGLNLSAYNLLYEAGWYENLTWDREKMKQKLKTDTVDNSFYPIIVDDTK